MVQHEAVVVRNAVKSYESSKVIIDNLNMTVSRGSIYGLLGPSGCGKTTLLSCIVGIQHLNSGEMWVLGGKPGSEKSGIPGPRVGYMPQEISLVGEFTRNDVLYYFGRICGLTDDKIEERQRFLTELLQLPPENRLVNNMSGGQQRRLSLAAALIHEPELLILDEPTVGLDPILREKIWTHLIKLTRDDNVTVVITTHYIEESKDADKIGLMRNGRLLAESTPQQFLEQFQSESLEEVFLTLSQTQDNLFVTDMSTTRRYQEFESNNVLSQEQTKEAEETISKNRLERRVSRWKRFKALMAKNSIQFLRHYSGIAFAVLFPVLQLSSFFIGIGGDPKGLTIGIVNHEAGNCRGDNFGNVWYDKERFTCHFNNISCKFVQNINDSFLAKKYYNDISEANAAVENGELVGVMHFNQNFSNALEKRVEQFLDVSEVDILAGEIDVYLDMSDRQVGLFTRIKLLEHFFDVYENMMEDCKISRKYADVPIRFENPIYGSLKFDYKRFMIPAYMLTLLFFLATTISTSLIITDRAEGVWHRSLVQGVTTGEILLAHILTQVVIIIIHTLMTLCLFLVWGMHSKGSLLLISVFNFLSGFCGLMYGFFLSVMCTNHTMAHYASAGSLFPLIILCGCLWPVEGMPEMLRWFSFFTPITVPALSLRQVLEKGQSMYESKVYNGVCVLSAWALFFFIVCVIRLKVKST